MNAIYETRYALDTPLRLAWTFSDSETSTRVFDTVPTHADLALKDKHFTITAQRYLGTPLAAFLAIEGQPHHGGRRDQPRMVDRNGFNAGAVAMGPKRTGTTTYATPYASSCCGQGPPSPPSLATSSPATSRRKQRQTRRTTTARTTRHGRHAVGKAATKGHHSRAVARTSTSA